MRLGTGLKETMKKQILEDLYDKNIARVLEERRDIVRRNYMSWLNQHEANIARIPDGFINRGYDVRMDVHKEANAEPGSYESIFDARVDKPVPVCEESTSSSYYTRTYAVPVSAENSPKVIANIAEYEKLVKEKEEATAYIDKSYEQCTSTTQLRKFWPQALHKYIPPEPTRAKREKKELDTSATNDIQDVLTQRMANNLLEG
jgi:hypothetical protein